MIRVLASIAPSIGALLVAATSPLQIAAQEPQGLAASAIANSRYTWLRRAAPGFRVYFQTDSYAASQQDSLLALLPPALHHARTLLHTSDLRASSTYSL